MAVLVTINTLKTFETHKTFFCPDTLAWSLLVKLQSSSGCRAAVMSLREVLSLFERGKAREA